MNTNYMNLAKTAGVVGALVDNLGRTPGAKEKAIVMLGQVYPLITSFAKIDFKAVLEERKTMTDEEKAQVNSEFDKAFHLDNVKLEEVMENAIDFLVSASTIVSAGQKLLKDVKSISSKEPQMEVAAIEQNQPAQIPVS